MMLIDYTLYTLCWLMALLIAVCAILVGVVISALVWEILRWLTGHGAADEESC